MSCPRPVCRPVTPANSSPPNSSPPNTSPPNSSSNSPPHVDYPEEEWELVAAEDGFGAEVDDIPRPVEFHAVRPSELCVGDIVRVKLRNKWAKGPFYHVGVFVGPDALPGPPDNTEARDANVVEFVKVASTTGSRGLVNYTPLHRFVEGRAELAESRPVENKTTLPQCNDGQVHRVIVNPSSGDAIACYKSLKGVCNMIVWDALGKLKAILLNPHPVEQCLHARDLLLCRSRFGFIIWGPSLSQSEYTVCEAEAITCLTVYPGTNLILSGSEGGLLSVWLPSGTKAKEIVVSDTAIGQIELMPENGEILVATATGFTVYSQSLEKVREVSFGIGLAIPSRSGAFRMLAVHPHTSDVIVAESRTVSIWSKRLDTISQRNQSYGYLPLRGAKESKLREIQLQNASMAPTITIHPITGDILCLTDILTIYTADGNLRKTISKGKAGKVTFSDLAVHPKTGDIFVSGYRQSLGQSEEPVPILYVYTMTGSSSTRWLISKATTDISAVRSMAFHPTTGDLITGHSDGTVSLWPVAPSAKIPPEVEVMRYPVQLARRATMQRALSLVGARREYCLVDKNCEHFACWCATGWARCLQAGRAVRKMGTALSAISTSSESLSSTRAKGRSSLDFLVPLVAQDTLEDARATFVHVPVPPTSEAAAPISCEHAVSSAWECTCCDPRLAHDCVRGLLEKIQDRTAVHGLDREETLAVLYYTFDLEGCKVCANATPSDDIYFQLNQSLRNATVTPGRTNAWAAYYILLTRALRKLPRRQSPAYRGIRHRVLPLSQSYGPGCYVAWPSFNSSTTTESVAHAFLPPDGKGTVFELRGLGYDLGPFSSMQFFGVQEDEVIFLPNTVWKCVEIRAAGSANRPDTDPPSADVVVLEVVDV